MELKVFRPLAETAAKAGGRLLAVGGQVRDQARAETGEVAPDWDLVLFGLELPAIETLAMDWGRAKTVGRRTGRTRVKEDGLIQIHWEGKLLEISPARRLTADGTELWAGAELIEDAEARDFTINAIYYDPLTEVFEDPLGGRRDLAAKKLRLCHPRSLEQDPLRILRAMGLVSRLGLEADGEALAEARRRQELLADIPSDRFWPEWRKWAASAEPHRGLRFLADSGLLNFWPLLAALPGTPQSPRFHPEGDAWEHTVLVVQALSATELPPEADRPTLTLAALLHDVGKPGVTTLHEGGWISRGHAQAGGPLARGFLEGIRAPERLIRAVVKLVERHMDLAFQPVTPRALRRLARRLGPETNLAECWALVAADWNGRGPTMEPFPLTLKQFLQPLGGRPAPVPLVWGRDLLSAFPGLTAGMELGRLLSLVEEAADEGQVTTREEALAYVATLLEGGS